MRVCLSGGGTGGHIYPAIAVAHELKRRHPQTEMLYIGTEKGLESKIVGQEHMPFQTIEVQGFRRSLSVRNIQTIRRFLLGVRKAKRILREFQPDVVLGTGGYVCAPVLYAAYRLGIPTAIHEQNVIPGLTNRFLSRFVDLVAVSFTGSEEQFPKSQKILVTGNPRATEVVQADASRGRQFLGLSSGARVVLVVGGSRGARAINEAFLGVLPRLEACLDVYFVYVTGEVHFEEICRRLKQICYPKERVLIYPFLYNMPEVLAMSSLIVNRAGASFLAEVTALGLPSVLIPSPYVTNNHQEANARWLEKAGAAVMVREAELTADRLYHTLSSLLRDPERLKRMQEASKKLGTPEACLRLCDALEALAKS